MPRPPAPSHRFPLHQHLTMTQLELRSWFLEPIPQNSNRWSSVRVWGLPLETSTRKWWRSSSIRTRHSANHLSTRYGTSVRLHGPICKRYAKALCMPDHVIRAFASGFPTKWKHMLIQPCPHLRRSTRIATSDDKRPEIPQNQRKGDKQPVTKRRLNPRRSAASKPIHKRPSHSSSLPNAPRGRIIGTGSRRRTRSVSTPTRVTKSSTRSNEINPPRKPAKAVKKPAKSALKPSTRPVKSSKTENQQKKPSRKRVAFADVKQSKPGVQRHPSIEPIPAPKPPSANWSEAQREAFELQRNTVPADDLDYWTEIASGVRGKTAEDCQALWESSWISPPKAKKKKVDWAKPPKSPKVSTPEVVLHVRKAATQKRSRNTGKYRSGVRRLADTIARDTSDDLLEPEIVTPKLSGISLRDGFEKVASLGMEGTPGTEVRMRRKQANQDGELATPEILARGKAFGLQEADKYVSLFKRRLGTCVVPDLKEGSAKTKKPADGGGLPKPKFIRTILTSFDSAEDDDESQASDEYDLFF